MIEKKRHTAVLIQKNVIAIIKAALQYMFYPKIAKKMPDDINTNITYMICASFTRQIILSLDINLCTYLIVKSADSSLNAKTSNKSRIILKGQLISKCSFGVKTSSKKPTKFFPGFLP